MDISASTNLASRPFRNERLPWLLAGALLIVAGLASVLHARLVDRILSGDEANTVRVVRQDEARIAELEDAIRREPPLKVEASELKRLRLFRDLVDQRVFPWRFLLAEFETLLPDNVRLTRISPSPAPSGRGTSIELSGEARNKDAAFSMAEALDASPAFSNAVLRSLVDSAAGTEFELEVIFDPEANRQDPGKSPVSAASRAR